MKQNGFIPRMKKVVREATPRALKTLWWIFKITATVSFAMFLLRYSGILYWIGTAVAPVFSIFGLPGSAAVAYVSGYFINVYSSVAVITSLELTARQITIIGTMQLAAHSMVVESAVQHKTGTSMVYVYILRTLASLALGVLLNLVLPGREAIVSDSISLADVPFFAIQGNFGTMFIDWLIGLAKLSAWMATLIYLLNILQRALYEFGIMEILSKVLGPLMNIFGLPRKASFLWVVTNVIGISYGAASIMDEMDRGTLNRQEIDLINTHIGISHSNLEDLLLFSALGGWWWAMLLSRWIMVTILVWCRRFILKIHSL